MAKRMGSKKHELLWKCNLLFAGENGQCVQTQLLTKNRGGSPWGRQRAPPARAGNPSPPLPNAELSPRAL